MALSGWSLPERLLSGESPKWLLRPTRTDRMSVALVAAVCSRAQCARNGFAVISRIIGRDVMTSQNQEFGFVVPDLPDLSLDQLAELGDSVLAHSLALYRQRLEGNGVVLSAFESSI